MVAPSFSDSMICKALSNVASVPSVSVRRNRHRDSTSPGLEASYDNQCQQSHSRHGLVVSAMIVRGGTSELEAIELVIRYGNTGISTARTGNSVRICSMPMTTVVRV